MSAAGIIISRLCSGLSQEFMSCEQMLANTLAQTQHTSQWKEKERETQGVGERTGTNKTLVGRETVFPFLSLEICFLHPHLSHCLSLSFLCENEKNKTRDRVAAVYFRLFVVCDVAVYLVCLKKTKPYCTSPNSAQHCNRQRTHFSLFFFFF